VTLNRYLTAQEAAEALNISLSTLYAYVSRGLIRSEPGGGKNRARLYHLEDIKRLQNRKTFRRNPDKAAEGALHAGAPVLESAITLITDDCLYYRGHNALELALQQPVEAVATLIWTGRLDGQIDWTAAPMALSSRCRAVALHLQDLKPIEKFQALLPVAAADDLPAYDLQAGAVAQTGARILRQMTIIATDGGFGGQNTAQSLQQAWVPANPEARSLLSATLILCADHELNASAFTARCAASTGAMPYAVVSAGLAALQGFKHGTASAQVEAFLTEVENTPSIRQAIVNRLKRGDSIPGYGHVIYQGVDPRATVLHRLLTDLYPGAPALALANAIIHEAGQLTDRRHNIDFMLATLARVLHLPDGGAPALFALGRTIGWIGHAIEQYQHPHIIRPRARYVGQRPFLAAGR